MQQHHRHHHQQQRHHHHRQTTDSTTTATTAPTATASTAQRRRFVTSRQKRQHDKDEKNRQARQQPENDVDLVAVSSSSSTSSESTPLRQGQRQQQQSQQQERQERPLIILPPSSQLQQSLPRPFREGGAGGQGEFGDFDASTPPPLSFQQDGSSASSAAAAAAAGTASAGGVTYNRMPRSWRGYEPATPLWLHLAELLKIRGGRPLSVADYMRLALTDPEHGYYTTKAKQQQSTAASSLEDDGGAVDEDDDFDTEDDYYDADDENNNSGSAIIGPSGDFITAPEVSQVFGECLGIWFYTQYQKQLQQREHQPQYQQRPQSWQWLECGPGNGTLIADLARFAMHYPDFGPRCRRVHLVEASPVLRRIQKRTLQEQLLSSGGDAAPVVRIKFEDDGGDSSSKERERQPSEDGDGPTISVHWHDSFSAFELWQQKQVQLYGDDKGGDDDVRIPTFCVCQEFLDALPVYSFQKTEEGWRERMVDLAVQDDDDDEEEELVRKPTSDCPFEGMKKPRLSIILAPEVTPALRTLLPVNEDGFLPDEGPMDNVGSVVEVNPEGILLAQDLARLVQRQGGAALIIDYGQEGTTDSVRGFLRHNQVHFLSLPGRVDVTADVDFAAIRHGVNARTYGARTPVRDEQNDGSQATVRAYGPVTQGDFLMSMGLQERVVAEIEKDTTTDEHAENLYEAMVRLASPEEMGTRFKVLAIAPVDDATGSPPPGF